MSEDLDSMIDAAISTEAPEPVEVENVEEQVESPQEEAEQPSQEKIEEAILHAPDKWSGFAKTKWAMLPKDVQQEVLNYHNTVSGYEKTLQDQAKVYNALETTIGDRKQAAIATYGSIEGMFDHYLKLDQWAASDPEGLIKWFAQQRGINLGNFAQSQQPAQEQPQDPVLQKLQELEAKLNGQNQDAEKQNTSSAQQMIEEFSRDPKYTFFNDLRFDMGKLMEAGLAKDMPTAYEMAFKTNPKTAPMYLEQELKKTNELKAAEAKKSKSAATIKGANGAINKKPGHMPLDEIIAQSMGGDRL